MTIRALTRDAARFEAARTKAAPRGWLDRTTMVEPGLYWIRDTAVIDTRTSTIHTFRLPNDTVYDPSIPPLGLSPDELSFVWLEGNLSDPHRLGVTRFKTGASYLLSIDPKRTPYGHGTEIDPEWLMQYFVWTRGQDGAHALAER
jgi:hypothetical protein